MEKEKVREWQKEINANPIVRKHHMKVVDTRWQLVKTVFMIMGIIFLLFGTTFVMALESNVIGVNEDGVLTVNVNFNIDLTKEMKEYIDNKVQQIIEATG